MTVHSWPDTRCAAPALILPPFSCPGRRMVRGSPTTRGRISMIRKSCRHRIRTSFGFHETATTITVNLAEQDAWHVATSTMAEPHSSSSQAHAPGAPFPPRIL